MFVPRSLDISIFVLWPDFFPVIFVVCFSEVIGRQRLTTGIAANHKNDKRQTWCFFSCCVAGRRNGQSDEAQFHGLCCGVLSGHPFETGKAHGRSTE